MSLYVGRRHGHALTWVIAPVDHWSVLAAYLDCSLYFVSILLTDLMHLSAWPLDMASWFTFFKSGQYYFDSSDAALCLAVLAAHLNHFLCILLVFFCYIWCNFLLCSPSCTYFFTFGQYSFDRFEYFLCIC